MSGFNFVSLLLLIGVLIFLGPVFTIIALNSLFNTGIDLNLGTWFAMFWLHLMLAGSFASKTKG